MKNFKPLFFAFFLILLSVNTCSAYTSSLNTYYVANGLGFFNDESSQFNGENIFSVIHYDSAESVYKIGLVSDLYSDDIKNVIVGHSPTVKILSCVVANDGYLYYSTNYGLYKSGRRNSITPLYTNDSSIIVVSTDTTAITCMRAYGDYVYFMDYSSYVMKRFSTATLLVSSQETHISPVGSFDIDTNGDIYTLQGSTNSRHIYKNNVQFITVPTIAVNIETRMGLQVTDNYIYVAGDHYSQPTKSAHLVYYKNNGTYKDVWNFEISNDFPNPGRIWGSVFWIGGKTTTAAAAYGSDYLSIVETEESGLSIISGSSGILENTYGLADVSPISTTYYNNSNLDFTVNIVTEEMSILEIQNDFVNYNYLVKLFDNNNAIVETYTIKSSEFNTEVATDGILGWFDWLLLGDKFVTYSGTSYFQNTNNWENGTYTIKLYEYNIANGNLAVLDSETLEVIETQFNGSVTTDTDISNIDTNDITSILLASPYFSATIIILAISLGAAAVAGGVGFLGGLFISVVLCVGTNLLPDWTVLLMFVVCLMGILSLRGN